MAHANTSNVVIHLVLVLGAGSSPFCNLPALLPPSPQPLMPQVQTFGWVGKAQFTTYPFLWADHLLFPHLSVMLRLCCAAESLAPVQ